MKRAAVLALMVLLAACQRQPAPGELPKDFKLASASIDLPDDADAPPLPEVLTTNCGACHSAGMLTAQPALKPEQWAATVKKMRDVYKAPIAEGEVPAILAALQQLPAGTAAAAPATAGKTAAP